MYYGAIKNCDIADGVGVRVSLFVSGCRNGCEGCFQPETWSFTYGSEYTKETEESILNLLKPSYIRGLTILGGEPMEPENQEEVLSLIKSVRATYPDKDIWMYTGFVFEDMTNPEARCCTKYSQEIIKNIDVLIDGKFVLAKRNLSLQFRGSDNQRLIDVPKTLETGVITWWDGQ